MIVPIVFENEQYTRENPVYLWVFYKFASLCLKSGAPIITTHDYAKKPSYFKSINHSAVNVMDYYGINDETYKKLNIYTISKTKVINKYKNGLDAWINLLSKRDKNLEKEIEKAVLEITKNGQKIDAFMVWTWLPSIEYIAKKYNIKVINQEGSAIRQPFYSRLLNYFQFQNKFDSTGIIEKYDELLKNNDVLFLTRKEILALLIDKQNINYLKHLDDVPEYEIGYGLGLNTDCFKAVYSEIDDEKVFEYLNSVSDSDKVCIRPHPKDPIDVSKYGFVEDKTPSPFLWILKCKSIVTDLSNIGYEVLLLGRNLISLSDRMPSSFSKKTNLSYLDDNVVSIRKVNFLTFYWFTPEELTQDIKYVNWRLSSPKVIDVYNYNLNYLLNEIGTSIEEVKNISPKERQKFILNKRNIVFDEGQNNINKKSKLNIFRRKK